MTAPPCPSMLRAAVRAARPRFARFATALARSLGAAALAASATGCLVISPPEYDHAERTPPVLTAVFPPPHRPVHIDQMDKIQDFSATVLSEDNGDPVEVYMYIDYGKLTSDKYPYRRRVQQDSVSAGTIAGGQRPLRARLDLNIDSLPDDATTPERECHTITVMASHAFNTKKCSCPDDPDDMSWITWQIINCDPNEPTCPTSCPALNCEATQCLFCDDPSIETKCANP